MIQPRTDVPKCGSPIYRYRHRPHRYILHRGWGRAGAGSSEREQAKQPNARFESPAAGARCPNSTRPRPPLPRVSQAVQEKELRASALPASLRRYRTEKLRLRLRACAAFVVGHQGRHRAFEHDHLSQWVHLSRKKLYKKMSQQRAHM